jgi:hypothetical protein
MKCINCETGAVNICFTSKGFRVRCLECGYEYSEDEVRRLVEQKTQAACSLNRE